MSCEIIYDRVFIKTDKYLIPLVLMGSSNCYEFVNGRDVRERHWQALSFARNFSFTEKELLEIISNLSVEKDCIRYNGKYISDMKAWMLRGIKEAMSLEDILKASGMPYLECALNSFYSKGEGFRKVTSNEELDAVIDELLSLQEKRAGSYVDFRFPTREKLKRPMKEVRGEVVVKRNGRYIAEIESEYRITTVADPTKAMTFASVEEARNAIPSVWLGGVQFVSSECKKKVWGIRVDDNRYIGKISKSRLHFSPKESVSLRFKSEKEARKYIANRKFVFSRFVSAEPVLLTE